MSDPADLSNPRLDDDWLVAFLTYTVTSQMERPVTRHSYGRGLWTSHHRIFAEVPMLKDSMDVGRLITQAINVRRIDYY